MTLLRLVALLAAATLCAAPAAKAQSDWSHLQTIPAGTPIRVAALHHIFLCDFVSATPDTLACDSTRTQFFHTSTHHQKFTQPIVQSVKLSRLIASQLTGGAIGAGTGALAGYAIDAGYSNHEDRSLVMLLFGALGALLGQSVGHYTDFLAGPTLYRAP